MLYIFLKKLKINKIVSIFLNSFLNFDKKFLKFKYLLKFLTDFLKFSEKTLKFYLKLF